MGIYRLLAIILLFTGLYGWLFLNLYTLQLEKSLYYSAKAASQNLIGAEKNRGNIYFTDKNNNEIQAAINRVFPTIYSVPEEIEDLENSAKNLSPIVGISEAALVKMFSKPGDLFELLIEKATPEQVEAVKGLQLKGIYIDNKTLRFYPFKNLASQALGFVGINKNTDEPSGLYGLESLYNSWLSEKNLKLTIDRNIQIRSEEILEELIEKFKATAGTIIVEDPKTGKILAITNKPDFDPNFYSNSKVGQFLNPAAQGIYEPGSVFKVITMAAGIDSGKITPNTSFNDTGSVKIADRIIKNWDLKGHGLVTMTEVIEKSINTGAVYAEKLMGHDIFYNYLVKFGFERKTGVDFPGEVAGDLRNLVNSKNEAVNFATASFGQGVAVTPIQLINAVAAIANGGILMRPYINADLKPEVIGRVIKEETSRQVSEMMVSAVDKAVVATVSHYKLAGKTGTAQIPDFKNGGYSGDFMHTYVGFGPVSDPKFIILIKLERPQAQLAGATVVPAFHELAQFIINYYQIQPDRL